MKCDVGSRPLDDEADWSSRCQRYLNEARMPLLVPRIRVPIELLRHPASRAATTATHEHSSLVSRDLARSARCHLMRHKEGGREA